MRTFLPFIIPEFAVNTRSGYSSEGGTTFTQDGRYLANYRNYHSKRREMARFSVKDSEAYERYSRDVTRQCRFIQPLLMRTAPDPASFKSKDIGEIFYLIKHK